MEYKEKYMYQLKDGEIGTSTSQIEIVLVYSKTLGTLDMAQGDEQEHLLDDTWTMYFHEPSDTDWTMSSYLRLEQISSVESFWQVHEGVRKYLSKGMFFLMREHVFPCWDDPSNLNGGCISIKVLKDEIESFWETVVVRMLGDRLLQNRHQDSDQTSTDSWSLINGISTSPKRYFCICKLWLKAGIPGDKEFLNLPSNYHGEPLYRSNIENIKHNNERGAF
jgi:Eukaryotic initiation factor 4E